MMDKNKANQVSSLQLLTFTFFFNHKHYLKKKKGPHSSLQNGGKETKWARGSKLSKNNKITGVSYFCSW